MGVGAVSASDIMDTDSDSVTDLQPTDTIEKTPVTKTTENKDIKTEESPEIDDSEGVVTTVSTDPVNEYVGQDVQLNATVDRTIPGARLSEGNVVFSRDGVNITDLIPVKNGEASVTVTLEEDWIGTSTLIANYIGTETVKSSQSEEVDFIVVPKVDTVLVLEDVSDYVGTTVELTAVVDSVHPGLRLNEGAVAFYFFDKGFAVVDVVDGKACYNITLTEDMMRYNAIEASYSGTRVYNESHVSANFTVVPKVGTVTVVDPVKGYVGDVVKLNAIVDSVNPGLRLSEGYVTFKVGNVDLVDEKGNKIVVPVKNGTASASITLTKDLSKYSTITAFYSGSRVYAVSSSTPESFKVLSKDTPKPHHNVIPKHTSKTIKQVRNVDTTSNAYKVYVNDNLVYSGKAITLGALNDIFELNFTNGHLLVYLDGELVFNGTTTDDLSLIIINIVEGLLGEHEIKVVFTDSEGNTNTYKENIVIK